MAVNGLVSSQQAFEHQFPSNIIALLKEAETEDYDEVLNTIRFNCTARQASVRWSTKVYSPSA